MRLPKLDLTGWAVVACVGAIAFVGLGLTRPSFLGFTFDPFGMNRRQIESLTDQRDVARSDAAARGLEAQGERDQAQRVETYHTQVVELRDFTARADAEARSAPDANEPLAADRAARLHAADRFLCERRPAICGAASAGDPAGG